MVDKYKVITSLHNMITALSKEARTNKDLTASEKSSINMTYDKFNNLFMSESSDPHSTILLAKETLDENHLDRLQQKLSKRCLSLFNDFENLSEEYVSQSKTPKP